MGKTFVLIHGSWHGGWAWRAVGRRLQALGHHAYAPTLPGHGPSVERVGITHSKCVASVVSCVREHDLRDVVLVGHSFGGTVICKVAEQVPERISRLIFVNAFVLADGQSIYDSLPSASIELLEQLTRASSDDTSLLPWEVWRAQFIQDASEERARSLWEQLSAEPNRPNVEKLSLEAFYSLAIPKSVVSSRQDIALPPGSFHPRMSSRLGTFKLVEMDGSHEILFTRPSELAEKLIEASG
jgi:pimeloyl-ACP methyl ester carboxylesterase